MINDAYIIEEDGRLIPINIMSKPQHGMESIYVQISQRIGIKVFETEAEAKRSMSRQKKAWKVGVAPKVYSEVLECIMPVGGTSLAIKDYRGREVYQAPRIPKKMTRRVYGYKTQVAKKIGYIGSDSEFDIFRDTMVDLGFCFEDLHKGNIGWVGNKLVCVDFGDASA